MFPFHFSLLCWYHHNYRYLRKYLQVPVCIQVPVLMDVDVSGGPDFSTFQQGYPSVLSAPHVESGLDAFLSMLDVALGWNLRNEMVFKFDTSMEEFDDIGGTSIYDNDKDNFNTGNNGSHKVVGLDFLLVSAPPSSNGLHSQALSTSTPSSGNFNAVRSDLNIDSLLSSMSLSSWSSLSTTAMATVIPSVITEARDWSPKRKEPVSTDQENIKHSKIEVPSDELGEPEGDECPVQQCKVTQHPDGPVWHQRTETELLSDDLGDNWCSCIKHWLAFKGMPMTYDSNWSTEDTDKFTEDIVTWWGLVQAKWRKTDLGLPLLDYSHDLSESNCGSKGGSELVLAAWCSFNTDMLHLVAT
ncbi:hypothetical protein EDD85DRAFT_782995 [Armillaria nabsnona]|nr:hypothetical protein EDD85DRAFT_782995 [Armillaria nabsnona]